MSVIAMPVTSTDVANGRYYVIPVEKDIGAKQGEQLDEVRHGDDLPLADHLNTVIQKESLVRGPIVDFDTLEAAMSLDQESEPAEGTESLEDGTSSSISSAESASLQLQALACSQRSSDGKSSDADTSATETPATSFDEDRDQENCDSRSNKSNGTSIPGDSESDTNSLPDTTDTDSVYQCDACGGEIEGLVIETRSQILCPSCFQCGSCQMLIEDLRYARTCHGDFCMSCYRYAIPTNRLKEEESGIKLEGKPKLEFPTAETELERRQRQRAEMKAARRAEKVTLARRADKEGVGPKESWSDDSLSLSGSDSEEGQVNPRMRQGIHP